MIASLLLLAAVAPLDQTYLVSCVGTLEVVESFSLEAQQRKFEIQYRERGKNVLDVAVKDAPSIAFDHSFSGKVDREWRGRETRSGLEFFANGERNRSVEPGVIRLSLIPKQKHRFTVEWLASTLGGSMAFGEAGSGVCERFFIEKSPEGSRQKS